MWKMQTLKVRDVMSFKKMDYTLCQGITTLVFGENKDNDSQKSNGSGKSALLECLSIGFTGSPMRKVKNEEMINDAAEDCEISLELINEKLSEVMVINRQIFRKGSSICTVDLYRNGELVVTDEAKKSSVEEYNKYILLQLCITKDELFNNFLLSKHKYQDFLSSSDKDKKDIINKFSNGNKVDEAIYKIKEDMTPFAERSRDIEIKMSHTKGKIEVVAEQIEEAKDNLFDKQNNLDGAIASIQEKIGAQRAVIRQLNLEREANACSYDKLIDTEESIKAMETSELSLSKAYEGLVDILSDNKMSELSDWSQKSALITKEYDKLKSEKSSLAQKLSEALGSKQTIQSSLDLTNQDLTKFTEEFPARSGRIQKQIQDIQASMERIDADVRKNKESLTTSQSLASSIQSKLAGSIKCPKCEHLFILADSNFDVKKETKDLESLNDKVQKISDKLKSLENNRLEQEQNKSKEQAKSRELSTERLGIENKIEDIQCQLQPISSQIKSILAQSQQMEEDIKAIPNKINNLLDQMFDEAYSIMDTAFGDTEREKNRTVNAIADAEGRITAFENSITQIKSDAETDITKSLENKLSELQKELDELELSKQDVGKSLKELELQEQRFIEFKTYLANTKIEALSAVTNEFLEHIGSDIRIKFSGYTVLKTGKVRDKISISLLRDGVDCGSYGKFSEGEKARANLASILAMQKLVNSNCELNRGLDLIVLDEILESVDEDGLASMFKVLNKLEITALVVSHGLVSENYPYKLIVTKENGESTLKHAN